MGRLKIYGVRNFDAIDGNEQIRKNSFSNNIGNSLFNNTVYKSIDWNMCELVSSPELSDIHCLVLANAFSRYFKEHLINLTKQIKARAKKTIVIGGGIHSSREFDDESLQEAVRNFALTIFETGGNIGVRGDITYGFFKRILGSTDGIYNIGCPSIRFFGKNIPPLQSKKELNRDSRIGVCFTPYGDSHEYTTFCDRIWREYPKSFAMMQDQCEGLLLMDGTMNPNSRIRELYPCYQQHFMIRHGRCRIEPNIQKWINMLTTFDFCIGSRIHGCMIGILAGVPTLLIAIDERQVEIAKFNRIPYIRQGIINRNTSLEALFSYAHENMDEIYNVYPENLKKYTDYLTMNNIPVSQDFIFDN